MTYYKLWSGLFDGTRVFDYVSGNKQTTNSVPAYPGFVFDGIANSIGLSPGPTSVSTIAMWVNPDDIAGHEFTITLSATDYLTIETGTLTKNGFAGGTTIRYVDGVAGSGVTANWHLIAITDTSAKSASSGTIGSRIGATFFAGRIGETMLFDRVLTPADMKSLYELTKWRYPNN